jgi:hypothetical protein
MAKELTVAPKDFARLERDILVAWRSLFPKIKPKLERTFPEIRRITGPTGLVVEETWHVDPALVYTKSILGRRAHQGWRVTEVIVRQTGGLHHDDPPDWDETETKLGTFRGTGQVARAIVMRAAHFHVNAVLEAEMERAWAQEESAAERAELGAARYEEEWERG